MATAEETYKIALNILARVGITGDVVAEHAKAMSELNKFQTFNEMNPPQMPQAPITDPTGQSTTPMSGEVNPLQNGGNGTLNLP